MCDSKGLSRIFFSMADTFWEMQGIWRDINDMFHSLSYGIVFSYGLLFL